MPFQKTRHVYPKIKFDTGLRIIQGQFCLSVCLSVYLSICLSVCLSLSLSLSLSRKTQQNFKSKYVWELKNKKSDFQITYVVYSKKSKRVL